MKEKEKCPKCGGTNLRKEYINARSVGADFDKDIDTGDKICKDCENLIKFTCKELGLTYKELGELIGYTESALKTIASTNKISDSLIKSIELLYKVKELENKLQDTEDLKHTLKKLLELK